jgi:hypothetical protein
VRGTSLIERGPVEPAAAVTLADYEWAYLEAQFGIDKHSDRTEERGPVSAFKTTDKIVAGAGKLWHDDTSIRPYVTTNNAVTSACLGWGWESTVGKGVLLGSGPPGGAAIDLACISWGTYVFFHDLRK